MTYFLDPPPEQFAAMDAALEKAGVPYEFRRYQEPVVPNRKYDTKWLLFECAMWRRSYEISEYAADVLRKRVDQLSQPMRFFYPPCDDEQH